MEFAIEDIFSNEEGDKFFTVNKEEYDHHEFTTSFIPRFCVTVYKYQGADINENYNIYDVNRMDKKQLYTARSRTKRLEFIHLNNKEVNNKYVKRRQPLIDRVNSRFNSLYQNGKIYKVTFDDGKGYVGSTCENLEVIMAGHLTNNGSQVYKNKHKNPKIELIIDVPCFDNKKDMTNLQKMMLYKIFVRKNEKSLTN